MIINILLMGSISALLIAITLVVAQYAIYLGVVIYERIYNNSQVKQEVSNKPEVHESNESKHEEELFLEEDDEFNERISRLREELIEDNFPVGDYERQYATSEAVTSCGTYNIPHEDIDVSLGESDEDEVSR